MGAVAGAEPATVVAGLADGDTTQMGADACEAKWSAMDSYHPDARVQVPSLSLL